MTNPPPPTSDPGANLAAGWDREEIGPSPLWSRLAHLPLQIEGYQVELLQRQVSSGFTRVTTLVTLQGRGCFGVGEDVTYEPELQEERLQAKGELELRGNYVLAGYSDLLERIFPATDIPYTRWGFESAALDLALRQACLSLSEATVSEPAPVRFVVSTRLGEEPSARIVQGWLEVDPAMEFKLDPQSSWTRELVSVLNETGRVRTVDLKGAYSGTPVDQPFDEELYLLVKKGFPEAFIEDPAPGPASLRVLSGAEGRLSWDAVIHSAADIAALALRPGAINIKPSRFGSLNRLLQAIEYCRGREIPMYGGGQFELGPARGQIQALASLFYPDGPNDVAPGDYNYGDPRPGLPRSPLLPGPPGRSGFVF